MGGVPMTRGQYKHQKHVKKMEDLMQKKTSEKNSTVNPDEASSLVPLLTQNENGLKPPSNHLPGKPYCSHLY